MAVPSDHMLLFQRAIERGSFAAAADEAGLSPSAVSKQISRLEARLGVRLINRTTRRLAPTPEGETYLLRVREILRAIDAAEAEIASAGTSPQGHLRVHAFPTFAVEHLAAALPGFMQRHPGISLEFLVTNREVDLLADNVDIGLRVGLLEDSTLVAVKIVGLTQVVCASPRYLAEHGRPRTPSDLARHSCLTLSHVPGASAWIFRGRHQQMRVDVRARVTADSAHMLLRLALEGMGIVRFGDIIVARPIRQGLLEPLLEEWQEPGNLPLWAVLPPGRQRTPKIRAFLDFLAQRFGSAPWRTEGAGRTT